jgi:hypothetical protein
MPHIFKETIFYSFRIFDDPLIRETNLDLDTIIPTCEEAKNKLINLFNEDGIFTFEMIRPEIYKHEISFNFLPNFRKGSIHFIFKPFEYIRILKNAYNICVVSWELKDVHLSSQNDIPFTNHKRMLSLVNEIWAFSNFQKDLLNQYNFPNTFLITEDSSNQDLSFDKMINRISAIRSNMNE